MSRMLSKMNLISVVQQLPKEDIETIQGYVEMIEQENQELKRNCNIGNENLNFYREENQQLKAINEQHRKINGKLREENQKYKEVIDKTTDKCNKTLNYINNTLLVNNVKVELTELLKIKGGLDTILESLVEEVE